MQDTPDVKRKRHVSEKKDMYLISRPVTCKNCLERGHNIRSCKQPKRLLPPKEKKKVGRPRTVNQVQEPSRQLDYMKPLLPNERKMQDTPSEKRNRHVSEKKDMYLNCRPITCKNCLERGHNIRSCKQPKRLLPPKEKKKVGRPRTVNQVAEPSRRSKVEEAKSQTEETNIAVSMSMDTVVEPQGGDDDETQAMISDLRESGYTEAQICAIINEYEERIDEREPLGDAIIEYDDERMEDEEEWINETQLPVVIHRRRPSERITKCKLRKKIGGPGCDLGTPFDID